MHAVVGALLLECRKQAELAGMAGEGHRRTTADAEPFLPKVEADFATTSDEVVAEDETTRRVIGDEHTEVLDVPGTEREVDLVPTKYR